MSASISNTVEITDASFNKPVFSQWETDRILYISGCASMPICRFAHPQLTHALVVNGEATTEDGMWKADVPNFLLQMNGPFFLSVVEERAGQIVEVAAAKYCVQPRMKPQDYEYTDNIGYVNWVVKAEEVQELIDEIQEKLDNGDLKGDPFVYSDFTEEQLEDLKSTLIINEWYTNNAKIEAAYQAGRLVLLKYHSGYLPLTSRDSATKHTFIGFTEPDGLTMAILNNGTWSFSSSKVVTQSFASNSDPEDLGEEASSGSSNYFSRADHVHKLPSAADVGAYVKPSGGIPKTDLASAVQTSLDKADTALQTAPVTSVNGETGDVVLDIPNIDPDAKTSDMTQSVGVDSSGKLWTAPSGGGGSVTVDDALSDSSTNPVQNKVVKAAVDAKYTKPSTGIPASDLAAGVIPDAEVFWAEYDVTTAAEILAAYNAHKVIICKYNGRSCPLVHVTGQSQFEFAYPHENNIDMLIVAGTNWSYWPYQLATQGAVDAKYTKPSGGIPATDLASAVQTSLGKADTALQSFTETDPTVPSWAKASSKPIYTASEVGAIAAPSSPAAGAFLVWNGSAWTAQTLATWQGGNY